MDGDVLSQRKQTHPMPRRDGDGLVISFNPLELDALLKGLLRCSINAAGRLVEIEGEGAYWLNRFHPSFSKCPRNRVWMPAKARCVCCHILDKSC